MDLPKQYDPQKVEQGKYEFWEGNDLFQAEVNKGKERFSMVIPPPNVTSELHVGHALQFTLHDIVIRYYRMTGKEACWFPGMDHAGIATQNVVEKKLEEEGKSRHDLGRDKFVERVWDWKETYGGKIKSQLQALGASPDWSRERFTLDEGLSDAVKEAFVRLYEEGYIYRGEYLTNWCPRCHTALSDIEVEHSEESGKLYWIEYPLADREGSVTIATTRPETMLGDSALAIHPQDDQATDLVGETALLPLIGRRIPIVSDEEIDQEFGSGILKITPAHDPTDFEIGERYGLESIVVIDKEGNIDFDGPYDGMDRYKARDAIVKDLEEQGYLVDDEEYTHSVGHCQRCGTVIEPYISTQWFVEMEDLAQPAKEVVRNDDVQLIPERWKRNYFNWMDDIKDWCISRQLWWGHRIPAWYCDDCDEVIVRREEPDSCPNCNSSSLTRETDVLDTWFSSSLWPFSVMGWPEETEELDYFFPTDLLITGFDILFFWVARMIIMSLHFRDEIPFKQVLLTPLVQDEQGEKMSSSKGNILDPLEIKEKYGADAIRFTMASSTTKGRGMKLGEREIEDNRNFLNKLWNASRLVVSSLDKSTEDELPPFKTLRLEDKWILSRFNKTVDAVEENLTKYNFKDCTTRIYDFLWKEFCDWYLELVKPRLYDEETDTTVEQTLYYLMIRIIKLIHPFVPFVSEEIWEKLRTGTSSVMTAQYPTVSEELVDQATEDKFAKLQQMVNAARSIRSEMNVPNNETVEILVNTDNSSLQELATDNQFFFKELVKAENVEASDMEEVPSMSGRRVLHDAEILVPLEGIIDIEEERTRIRSKLDSVEDDLEQTLSKLNNEEFLKNAPTNIIDKEKDKKQELKDKKQRLLRNLEALED